MEQLMGEYRAVLGGLYRRREELAAQIGLCRRRLAVLDEEIDELEEAVMLLRQYPGERREAG